MIKLVGFLILCVIKGNLSLDALVDTKKGLIEGLRADDGNYSMFLGIPYGRVDENNPFGAAHPYPKFDEVFEAYDDFRICPQVLSSQVTGTLDCLRLNVFVPDEATTHKKLPVLVWIHGGGFIKGSGDRTVSGPKYLIRHDIILVSMNYRLGPYGFMCLDVPEVSGNQGLKDQTMALRWIKENIEYFGGDPNKITVYGESAGTASVELHIASRNEKLFEQAILSSGSTYGVLFMGKTDYSAPIKIAKQLGYESDNVKDALEYLKQTDVKLVVAAVNDIKLTLSGICIEKDSNESFLTEHPASISTLAKAKNMSIMSGYNTYESIFDYFNQPAEYFSNIDPFKDYLDHLDLPDDKYVAAYRAIRRYYIGDSPISIDVSFALTSFRSDVKVNHPIEKSIKRFRDSGVTSVYHYIFGYNGGRNYVKVRSNVTDSGLYWGASHADELGYIFDIAVLDTDVSEKDQLMLDMMTTYWTNFVKYGNPTPEETDLLPIIWPEITADSLNYMYIDAPEKFVYAAPFHDRQVFWDLIDELYLK